MKKVYLLVLGTAMLLLCSCGQEKQENTFLLGSDYEYQFADGVHPINRLSEDEDGNIYFFRGHYAYRYDVKTNAISPLCGKANCLHDRESNPDRYADCNAYMPPSDLSDGGYNGVAYMDQKVYLVMESEGQDGTFFQVCELSKDGTKRDKIYEWQSEAGDWIFHRGYLYYTSRITDEDGTEHHSLNRVKLSGFGKKEKRIYEVPDNLNVYYFGTSAAYGNYLYFRCWGVDKNEAVTKENAKELMKEVFYVCDLDSLECKALDSPKEGESISMVTFMNDRLVFGLNTLEEEQNIYEAELDGSGCRTVLEDVSSWRYVFSDGKNLYLSDFVKYSYEKMHGMAEDSEQSSPTHMEVYDSNYQKIDFFEEELNETQSDIPIGLGDRRYWLKLINTDSGESCTLYSGERSQIGTLNGQTFKMDMIAELKEAPAD